MRTPPSRSWRSSRSTRRNSRTSPRRNRPIREAPRRAETSGTIRPWPNVPRSPPFWALPVSVDTGSAQKGGDLGTFGQGRMVPEFERVAFALQPGQLSDVVKTQYGYHIIMVSERKEGERKPFDSVKEQIKATLRNKQLQDQMQGHFDALKRDAGLTLDEAALARITPPAGGPPVPAGGH